MSEKFATAKQGVYPKGDTFRGILELQLEAAVLELMVFGELKKGNGSARAVLSNIYNLLLPSIIEIFCTLIVKYLFVILFEDFVSRFLIVN